MRRFVFIFLLLPSPLLSADAKEKCCGDSRAFVFEMDYSKKQLVRKSFYRHPKSHFCKNLEPKNFGNAYLVIKKKDGKNKKNDTLLKIKIYLPPVSHEETLVKERQLKNEIGIIQKTLVNVKVPECIDFDRKDLLVEIFSLDSQTLIAKGVLNQ